jgi:hypothetical protein
MRRPDLANRVPLYYAFRDAVRFAIYLPVLPADSEVGCMPMAPLVGSKRCESDMVTRPTIPEAHATLLHRNRLQKISVLQTCNNSKRDGNLQYRLPAPYWEGQTSVQLPYLDRGGRVVQLK